MAKAKATVEELVVMIERGGGRKRGHSHFPDDTGCIASIFCMGVG